MFNKSLPSKYFLTKEAIETLLHKNNIQYQSCELYSDFVQSLIAIVIDTHLEDVIVTREQQLKHFDWCFRTNISNFDKENIHFSNTTELYDYFLILIFEMFYNKPDKSKKTTDSLIKLCNVLFNTNIAKTDSDIETLGEIYNLFEKSLSKV